MKRIIFLLVAVASLAGLLAFRTSASGNAREKSSPVDASPIYGVTIPQGYRDWKLISVAHEEGDFNQLRAQLGNDIAIKAYREKKLPFPEGAIIVALHWKRIPSDEDNKVFGHVQAFVAGSPVNVQVMVKDSTKYATSGGWGFADFTDGKPSDEANHKTCFPCHEPAKAHDFVYTHYAPTNGPIRSSRTNEEPSPRIWRPPFGFIAVVLAAGSLAGLITFYLLVPPPVPKILRSTQITHSGRVDPYGGIQTDGTRVYYIEREGDHWNLMQNSVGGGESQNVAAPFRNTSKRDSRFVKVRLLRFHNSPLVVQKKLWMLALRVN